MTTAEYREKLNAELPHYRAVHSLRVDIATRILINEYPLEYDVLLRSGDYGYQEVKAELRRRHRDEWRAILRDVPGTVTDVRLGLTADRLKEWPWSD